MKDLYIKEVSNGFVICEAGQFRETTGTEYVAKTAKELGELVTKLADDLSDTVARPEDRDG